MYGRNVSLQCNYKFNYNYCTTKICMHACMVRGLRNLFDPCNNFMNFVTTIQGSGSDQFEILNQLGTRKI